MIPRTAIFPATMAVLVMRMFLTGMSVFMFVMVAMNIRVEIKIPGKKVVYRIIRIT